MIQIEINDIWYQKTIIQEDGITQIVTPETYTAYQVKMDKIYFIEKKIEMLKELRANLEELCEALDIEIGLEYKKTLKK